MRKPWMKLYTADWRADPALRMCSIAARGLWFEMMCLMHEAKPYGHMLVKGQKVTDRQLAALAGVTIKEAIGLVQELREAGVFSEDDGTIWSRRMVRDHAKASQNSDDGYQGGNPEIRRGTVPKSERVRPFKRSDSPSKTKRIFDREEGRCHWCHVPLIWEGDGSGEQPNLFHVDHVVAVCDGGTNDENNLVAACAACNHRRARQKHPTISEGDNPTPTNLIVGCQSDDKAQIPDTRSKILEAESKGKERARDALALFDEPEAEPEPEKSSQFDQFWVKYPHKIGKDAARKSFNSIMKSRKVVFEFLMLKLELYARKTDDRPWCNPATWLNQGRWDDQPAIGAQHYEKASGNGAKPNGITAAIDRQIEYFEREARRNGEAREAPPRLLSDG